MAERHSRMIGFVDVATEGEGASSGASGASRAPGAAPGYGPHPKDGQRASASASASESASASAPTGAGSKRRRPERGMRPPTQAPRSNGMRNQYIHDRQVLLDHFSNQEQGANDTPPTDLFSKMPADEFGDDPYEGKKVEDVTHKVSMTNLAPQARAKIEADLAELAKAPSRTIATAKVVDPTAITVPETHIHRSIMIPPSVQSVLDAKGDALTAMNPDHCAELCYMDAYNSVENFWVACEMSMEDTGQPPSHTVQSVIQLARPSVIHSVEKKGANLRLIFDMGRRFVFYVVIEARVRRTYVLEEGNKEWSPDMRETLGPLPVEVLARAYFECPCIAKGATQGDGVIG